MNKIKWVRKKKRTQGTGSEIKDPPGGNGPQSESELGDDDEYEDETDEEEVEYEPDRWKISGDSLIRIHNEPRTKLFIPAEVALSDPCPIPIKYVDSWRTTTFTNL